MVKTGSCLHRLMMRTDTVDQAAPDQTLTVDQAAPDQAANDLYNNMLGLGLGLGLG